jgi:mitochondrial fission protein ELM1
MQINNHPPEKIDTQSSLIIVDDMKIGTKKQALGLAQALDVITTHEINVSYERLNWLAPKLLRYTTASIKTNRELSYLDNQYKWVISGGRKAAAYASSLRKKMPWACFIHLLNPYGLEDYFDYIITPNHDRRNGCKYLQITGALNDLNWGKMAASANKFQSLFSHLQRPLHGILIGGSNKTHTFTKEQLISLFKSSDALQKNYGGSLIISASRRTPNEFTTLIEDYSNSQKSRYFWHPGIEKSQENPYDGILSLCDDFLITSDSVSMLLEAAFTAKPIYMHELPNKSRKFQTLYDELREKNIISNIGEEPSKYSALDEKMRIAKIIKQNQQNIS